MLKLKTIIFAVFAFFMVATPAFAASNTKYTFNNVDINGTVVEIEASIRSSKTNPYTTCNYYSDNYIGYLGMYTSSDRVGQDVGLILNYCISHFEERVL